VNNKITKYWWMKIKKKTEKKEEKINLNKLLKNFVNPS
jgi:hypothetical protein